MRVPSAGILILALTLGGAAAVVSGAPAPTSNTASAAPVADQGSCSAGSDCTRGCSLYVAIRPRGDLLTAPCANRALAPCIEEVARAATRPGTPTGRLCPGALTGFPHRLLPPAAKELRLRAERYLRSQQRARQKSR